MSVKKKQQKTLQIFFWTNGKKRNRNETKIKSGGIACHYMCWTERFKCITCVQFGYWSTITEYRTQQSSASRPMNNGFQLRLLNILISETAYPLTARFQFQVQRFFFSYSIQRILHTHTPNGLRLSGHRRMNRKWINFNNNDGDSNEKRNEKKNSVDVRNLKRTNEVVIQFSRCSALLSPASRRPAIGFHTFIRIALKCTAKLVHMTTGRRKCATSMLFHIFFIFFLLFPKPSFLN